MTEHTAWLELRDALLAEPGATDAYRTARLALELGARVRELREGLGWSWAELGVKAGLSEAGMERLEMGGTVPSLRVLDRLAEALGADLEVRLRVE